MSHPFTPDRLEHKRQYGIDEIVLLCIGKTGDTGKSHTPSASDATQVSRLEVDSAYNVIPVYNLEPWICVNDKLADTVNGWGTYNDGEDDVPRVTCKPRMEANPLIDQHKLGGVDDARCDDKDSYGINVTPGATLATNLYGLSDGMCTHVNPHYGAGAAGEIYAILNNGLIFTIHDPAWADKEITVVLVSAKHQRKIHGDPHWVNFIDTTFDDFEKNSSDFHLSDHHRNISSNSLPYYPLRDNSVPAIAGEGQWWRYRIIGDWAAPKYQSGGGSTGTSLTYASTFHNLVSKKQGEARTVNAGGSITVLQEGSSSSSCVGDGQPDIEASIIQEGAAPYTEERCEPGIEGDPSCDTSTLQQGSTSLEVETACRNVMYITEEGLITPNPLTEDGTLSNITDVNFIASSGDDSYVVTYAGIEGGMTVGQHMVSRTGRDPKDDKTVGFHVDYKDENDVIDIDTGQKKDRMFISAYDDEAVSAGALTVMRSTDPGFVGINDIVGQSEIILPETIFNVQSTGDAVTRITSLASSHKASVQLLNPSNTLDEGFEIEYSQSTARADMSMFRNMGKKTIISIDRETNKVGIHTVEPNELLTLSSGIIGRATISVQEQVVDPSPTADYGKVYVKPVEGYDSQTQSLYFEDDTGNVFDLIFNPSLDYRMVYFDDNCNTYVGETPDSRDDISGQTDNTAVGCKALYNITTGDRNTAVGAYAGLGVTDGSDNLFLGKSAGAALVHGDDNILIGDVLSSNASDTFNSNILIGRGNLSPAEDYTFLLGDTNPVIRATVGPDFGDRHLYVARDTQFSIESSEQTELLTLRHKNTSEGMESWIEKVDIAGRDNPEGTVDFVFTSKETTGATIMTEKLLTLSHDAAAMTNSCSYQVSDPARPMATLKGDLNIQGTINFCDGTSLDSSDGLVYAPGSGINSSVNTDTGNTEFNLDIEELSFAASLSGPDTHLAVSTDNILRKVNIDGLAEILSEGEPRIISCGGGTGQNHVFTNNSTIEGNTCYTTFFGFRAGDHAAAASGSNFIGYQAGSHAEGISANAVDSCEHSNFMGYMAGYEVQNADHSVFIGNAAGYKADNSRVSVFIGDSAGTNASSERSIGIGDNALENVTGVYNIEFTAGIGGDHRLFGQGEISNALAIGTCIAGDMEDKKVSLGDARINPDAVLEVKAFADDTRLQEWKDYNNNVVAYIDKDGKLYVNGGVVYSA